MSRDNRVVVAADNPVEAGKLLAAGAVHPRNPLHHPRDYTAVVAASAAAREAAAGNRRLGQDNN